MIQTLSDLLLPCCLQFYTNFMQQTWTWSSSKDQRASNTISAFQIHWIKLDETEIPMNVYQSCVLCLEFSIRKVYEECLSLFGFHSFQVEINDRWFISIQWILLVNLSLRSNAAEMMNSFEKSTPDLQCSHDLVRSHTPTFSFNHYNMNINHFSQQKKFK